MKRNKKEERIHLTDHFTYRIIDNVIYLFENSLVSEEEFKIVLKKVSMIILDNDVDYINISSKDIEKKKEYYMDLGFSLSYYSIDKLNTLYDGYDDKKAYRCYAVMTKTDFFNIGKKDNKEEIIYKENKHNNSNKGFISNMFLLFGGLLFLCYLCMQFAIMLVELGR